MVALLRMLIYFLTLSSANKQYSTSRIRKSSTDDTNNPLAPPVKNTGRARVLMPSSQSYEVAPPSREPSKQRNGPIRPMNARGDDFIRKMKAKKAKKGVTKPIG